MSEGEHGYQVLARKYRPETFATLVGQDAMVRTLKNAFAADRIAQAFILTGIRGTGKTTTARIIAKGLNCTGPAGADGPTTEPCGTCEQCLAIAEGRHVDVLEMDAASHTGVDNIREIIESVHYRAASARYKIYIIDEVHMLSTSAFNALLKTLEEPPPHVKFIFATTEIRKVPVTVLSRCQRFDLRRIEPEVMIEMLRRIASGEGAKISDDALALITRAAEGSARDATSLLDQAISHGGGGADAQETTVDQVRAMLGLADRGRVLDLFDMILRGAPADALTELQAQYADGADPLTVLRDLAEITHWISILKITPEAVDDPTIGPDEARRGKEMAGAAPMRALTRLWQMLLKSIEEVAAAPNAMMAAEMAIIRLTHVADLPDPDALIRKVQASLSAGEFSPVAPQGGGAGPVAHMQRGPASHAAPPAPAPRMQASGGAIAGPAPALAQAPDSVTALQAFSDVVELIRRMRDMQLLLAVEDHLHLVHYTPGRIEFQPGIKAPADLAQRLAERLRSWTGGYRWVVSLVREGGQPTISQTREAAMEAARQRALQGPIAQAILASFPDARITSIRRPPAEVEIDADQDTSQHETSDGVLAEVAEWDPFEDED